MNQKNDIFSIGQTVKTSVNRTAQRQQWVEDNFLDGRAQEEYLSSSFNLNKLRWLFLTIAILFVVIIGRAGYLQLIKGRDYRQAAEENRIRIQEIKAPRGIITDRQGKKLTDNVPNFILSVTGADLPKIESDRAKVIQKISDITQLNSADITRAIENQTTVVTNNLADPEAEQLKDNRNELPGVSITASSGQKFTLTVTPADWPASDAERSKILNKISDLSHISVAEIMQSIHDQAYNSYHASTIIEHLPYDQAMQLNIASADLPGITLNTSTARQFLVDQTFAHLLGYTGKVSPQDLLDHPDYSYDDYIGKAGIESYYESELKGVKGKKEVEVDSLGKESKIITQTKPINGENITLTIDANLQETLGAAIDKVVKSSTGITGAAAVAIDPNSGEILALASSPTFDNQAMNDGLNQEQYDKLANDLKMPLFNRAISAEYPSGSTIKPLISLAALQEGIINENTTFVSTGGIRIGQWFFPDWKPGGHGVTDVKKALSESINTFFYIIGGGYENVTGLGVDRINQYLKLFGLGQPLGIDLAGEAGGFLPTKEWKETVKKENWYIGDTYHMSIGQGDLLVTPLQVASYTATVANGGTFYQPHLVKSFSDANHNIIQEIKPVIVRNNFINSDYYRIVREGLRQGVTSGSSSALANLPFTVAGKTGTAQFGDLDKTHAWYTCFAPYENPQIAITVIVEGAGEGHQIALPIAREGLLTWYNETNK